ncbi:tryptophan synthase subunit alpha [Nitratidesulfovibrio vulgaris]|uniref:tryptophan synthase subunit alpha n=1 Tax=Nitratidesulfovibrio vulgaris TaxID=881 RepID=UPI0013DE908B|nr:tryptophan synthase subunit alpha [Nitratidesulfovibrio vulgaris]
MSASRLERRIREAQAAGRPALIPFLTAGFPTPERFWDELEALDAAGADIIEVGVPFSDPVADGPVVAAASQRALESGVTLRWIMDGLAARKGRLRAGLVLMGYLNPFMQYGFERFVSDAADAGVAGCIIPDLPLDEDADLRALLAARGMDLIALVGPNTGEGRMREYAAVASGYVYVVSVMGTTGVRDGLPVEVADTLARARQCFSIPVALGFGISRPAQLEGLSHPPDAVIFGSALLRHLDAGGDAASFMKAWAER